MPQGEAMNQPSQSHAIHRAHDEVSAAAEDWLGADQAVRALHQRLADDPVEEPGTWDALVAARQAREERIHRLGRAMATWLALGGELELIDPAGAPEAPHTAPEAPSLVAPLPAAPPQADDPAVVPDGSDDAAPDVLEAPPRPPEPGPSGEVTAAPPEPAPVVPVGPPASREALLAFQNKGLRGTTPPPDTDRLPRAQAHLDLLIEAIAAPLTTTMVTRIRTWSDLISLIDPLSDAVLVPSIRALVARLRAFQAHGDHRDMPALFGTLSRWSRTRQPGFIHGLATRHQPQSDSWDDDANSALADLRQEVPAPPKVQQTTSPEAALADLSPESVAAMSTAELHSTVLGVLGDGVQAGDPRLLKLVGPRYNDLKGDSRLAPVRKAWKKYDKRQHRGKPRIADAPAEDWPFWHLTRGRTAVIVGGDPRPANRDKIRDAFGFARVEWPEHSATLLDRLSAKLASGTIDVAIFNRFGGHITDDKLLPAVKGDLSRWVRADTGYGVAQVKAAMERHWANLTLSDDAGSASDGPEEAP